MKLIVVICLLLTACSKELPYDPITFHPGNIVEVANDGFYNGCTGITVGFDQWVIRYDKKDKQVAWQPRYQLFEVACPNLKPKDFTYDWLKVNQSSLKLKKVKK